MADLKSSLHEAQKKPMFFAFVAKGTEGKLLVEKAKIPAKQIAEAKKACGGGTVFQGRCLFENDTMVFEVPVEPPGTLAATIKKVIKADSTLALNVVVRVNTALAEGADGNTEAVEIPPPLVAAPVSAPPGSASPAPSPPPVAAPASASPTSAPPVPPEPSAAAPAAPPQAANPQAAAVLKRLNGLSAGIKKAMAGPNKARVQTLFVAVNGLIKSRDYVKADKTLDELEAILNQTSAPPAPPVAPTPPQAPPLDPLEAEWKSRVAAMEPRVLDAQKKRPG